jgi:hypothetical protein
MEQSIPYQTIAYDIAAETQESGGPQLILFAILVCGANHRFIDPTIKIGPVPVEERVEELFQ